MVPNRIVKYNLLFSSSAYLSTYRKTFYRKQFTPWSGSKLHYSACTATPCHVAPSQLENIFPWLLLSRPLHLHSRAVKGSPFVQRFEYHLADGSILLFAVPGHHSRYNLCQLLQMHVFNVSFEKKLHFHGMVFCSSMARFLPHYPPPIPCCTPSLAYKESRDTKKQ